MTHDFLAHIDLPLFDALDGSINDIRPIISSFADWTILEFIEAARRIPSRGAHFDTAMTLYTHHSAYNKEIRKLLAFCTSVTTLLVKWRHTAECEFADRHSYLIAKERRARSFVREQLGNLMFSRGDAPILMELLSAMEKERAIIPRANIWNCITPYNCALIAHKIKQESVDAPWTCVFSYAGGESGRTYHNMMKVFAGKCMADLYCAVEAADVTAAMAALRYILDKCQPYDIAYIVNARACSEAWRTMWNKEIYRFPRSRLCTDKMRLSDDCYLLAHGRAVMTTRSWHNRNVASGQ